METVFDVRNLVAGYTNADILRGVNLRVDAGEVVALLGPNGAGKSTLIRSAAGIVPRRSGNLVFNGTDIINLPNHRIVSSGLVCVPEGRLVFPPLTVVDNLLLGSVQLKGNKNAVNERYDFAYELFPRLAERRLNLAGTLSGGEQQMLAVARALMSDPKFLLLDEPFLGLAPKVVDEIQDALERLRKTGLTILLVEQKLDIALNFASRAYVLIKGKIAHEDNTAALRAREDLSDIYFQLATDEDQSGH